MSGPPFSSVDRALSWAFAVVARDIGDISSIYKRRDTDPPREAEWTPFEKHGQAGAILGFADQVLDEREKTYVLARFGRDRGCERRMVDWVAALVGTGVHNRRALEKVWAIHCGAKIGRAALAKDMGLGTNWRPALAFKGKVTQQLGHVAQAVTIKLEPVLLEKKIVEYSEQTP